MFLMRYNYFLSRKFQECVYASKRYSLKLPYRLFIPHGYHSNKRYPLVLVLHGGGERGNENREQLTSGVRAFVSKYAQSIQNCFVLAPQCPKNTQWHSTKTGELPFYNYNIDDIPETKIMKILIEMIMNLQVEFKIDKNRIYVTGYSMGSTGTWNILMRYPDIFAAALTINGVSDPSKAKRISHIPIWAFHGSKDHISPIENTKQMISALKNSGGKPRFTEYRGLGHDIWNRVYGERDVIKWLLSQRR